MSKMLCKYRMIIIAALVAACTLALCACGAVGGAAEPTAQPTVEQTVDPAATAVPTPEPTPDVTEIGVVISELMPSNKSSITDADGDLCDWIELYNPTDEPCELGGFWLSDSDKQPCKWRIPDLTLRSGEYAVIFASKKDRDEGELHTNFALSREGDTLYLSSPEGWPLLQVSYEDCPTDASLCIGEDGYVPSYYPTPGYPNTAEGYESYLAVNDRHGALTINEAVTYNDDFSYHAAGYYDWAELKNSSDETIRLSDYYISDDAQEPARFRLPDVTLGPGKTYVVYLGEPNRETAACHAPFKLSSAGDSLYIFNADGTLCDRMGLYNVPLNGSKGRIDDESGFFLFPVRTPAAANRDGARYMADMPRSVTSTGVYNGVEYLDVELSGEGTIYYTTNGTVPSTVSPVYDGPIRLSSTCLIRAICVEDGKLTSPTANFSYIINENHDLPVVSVALEPMKLDVLYHHNTHMEYDSHAEYFDDEGSFSSDCMITMHGASARTVWKKKSFKLVFRDRYGGDINYDLFGSGITEFHSVVLRGGDSDGMHTFREPLAAEAADAVCTDDPFALDSRFCVLYVNGKYYGIFTLREAYSRKYVESHTGSDEDTVSISRAPIKIEYQPELFGLYQFISTCDMSDSANYAYIADRMDMHSLAQWMCLEGYFNNLDPTGNIRYVRGSMPDGKWRTMFFDLDISMTNGNANLYPVLDTGSQIGRMTTNLLRSAEFRQVLLETASELYKNGLNHELVVGIFDRMVAELENEMPRNIKRWGESQITYNNNIVWQRSLFNAARDQSWKDMIQQLTQADDETMAKYFPD